MRGAVSPRGASGAARGSPAGRVRDTPTTAPPHGGDDEGRGEVEDGAGPRERVLRAHIAQAFATAASGSSTDLPVASSSVAPASSGAPAGKCETGKLLESDKTKPRVGQQVEKRNAEMENTDDSEEYPAAAGRVGQGCAGGAMDGWAPVPNDSEHAYAGLSDKWRGWRPEAGVPLMPGPRRSKWEHQMLKGYENA